MTLDEIKNKADAEISFDISKHIDLIKVKIRLHGEIDMNFPHHCIKEIINICDSLSIPAYHVCENTISFANSYRRLYEREKRR